MEPALELALQTTSVDALLKAPPRGVALKCVDFAKVVMPNAIDTRLYQIMLSHRMGDPTNRLCVLFPNHATRPLIASTEYRSLRAWNRALNETLTDSLDETPEAGDVKLCIAYGRHLYVCKAFAGRLYMFWAHVHRGDGVLGTQMPVLINTDAKLQPKAVMVFHAQPSEPAHGERIPLTHATPVLRWDRHRMGGHPFVCEERRPNTTGKLALPTAQRERDARYELTRSAAPIHHRPLLMHNPLKGEPPHARGTTSVTTTDDDDSGVTVHVSSVEYEDEGIVVNFTKPIKA